MAVTPPVLLGTSGAGRRTGSSTVPLTFSHTVPTGTDSLIIAIVFTDFFAADVTVTFGAVPVPCIQLPPQGNVASDVRLYELLNPPPGTATISATPTNNCSMAGIAWNIGHYGCIRWMNGNGVNVGPFPDPAQTIYTHPTDLVFDLVDARNSTSFVPVGAVSLLADLSAADAFAKCASAHWPTTPLVDELTPTHWVMTPPTNFGQVVIAIAGFDDAPPAGAPYAIGRATDFMNPTSGAGAGAAINEYYWKHEVLSTHRFLVVLVGEENEGGAGQVNSVTYAGIPLTPLVIDVPSDRSLWYLENAPVGIDYVRVSNSHFWRFSGSAYSLDTDGIIAYAVRNTQTDVLAVPAAPGAIVIDLISMENTTIINNLRGTPSLGQVQLYQQPINLFMQNGALGFGGVSGLGSWAISDANIYNMGWVLVPDSVSQQIAFSFVGNEPPPPPPGREGCPDQLDLLPADGDGCSNQLAPQAV